MLQLILTYPCGRAAQRFGTAGPRQLNPKLEIWFRFDFQTAGYAGSNLIFNFFFLSQPSILIFF